MTLDRKCASLPGSDGFDFFSVQRNTEGTIRQFSTVAECHWYTFADGQVGRAIQHWTALNCCLRLLRPLLASVQWPSMLLKGSVPSECRRFNR